LCVALSITLAACSSLPGGGSGNNSTATPAQPGCEKLPTTSNKEKIAIGAAAGAALGLAAGNAAGGTHRGRHRVQGALGGALVGALAGAAFGNEIDVEEQPDGSVKLKIPGSVMFASGQSSLSPGFQDTLSRVTQSIRKYCGVTVRAVGHTDNIGTPAANQSLSEARARSVQRYMKAQGFDAQRLSAEGRGQTEPIAPNADETSRQKNRRVELFVRPPAA
jgi:outer membrane protein OmpA-like peptidoglycan-associated protein